jgi:hypothetical protein
VPDTVCCPRCWSWSELRKSASCKRCGTPLVFPDGRLVEPIPVHANGQPTPPPLVTAVVPAVAMDWGAPPPPLPPPSLGGPLHVDAAARGQSIDWVSVARWVTAGYGALVVIALLLVGLLVRHITVAVPNIDAPGLTNQTFDVGPAMVIAAGFAAALFGLFVWLIQFAVARGILLFLFAVAALGALARISGGSGAVVATGLASLLLDCGYGFVLLMSLISRPRSPY